MDRTVSAGLVLALAGWLAVMTAQAARERKLGLVAAHAFPEERLTLATASACELRRLPGIGETRALEIVRARWRLRGSDERFELASLPGIGEATARRVAEALGETGDAAPP